jgi:hypothetical protein
MQIEFRFSIRGPTILLQHCLTFINKNYLDDQINCQLLECNIFTHHVYRYGKKIRKIQIRVQRPSVTICLRTSVLDPGCSPGTRILIFHLYGSCISGPGSYNTNKRRGEPKNLLFCLFCSHKFNKL